MGAKMSPGPNTTQTAPRTHGHTHRRGPAETQEQPTALPAATVGKHEQENKRAIGSQPEVQNKCP